MDEWHVHVPNSPYGAHICAYNHDAHTRIFEMFCKSKIIEFDWGVSGVGGILWISVPFPLSCCGIWLWMNHSSHTLLCSDALSSRVLLCAMHACIHHASIGFGALL